MARRAPTLREAVRQAAAAWQDVEGACTALAHYAGPRPARQHVAVLARLNEAKAALSAAYDALVPRRAARVRRRPNTRPARQEPLWRCNYCGALVWESQRRPHLKLVELVPDHLWPTDASLAAHYTLDPERTDNADDTEDELDGW